MTWHVSRSSICAPCPKCGGQPLFTQGEQLRTRDGNTDLATMRCRCGFEGYTGNVDDLEVTQAQWNKRVAHENAHAPLEKMLCDLCERPMEVVYSCAACEARKAR